jgi:hypothetical protein
MMNETKIRLSEEEEELVKNAEIILTKNTVMKKMHGLLEEVQDLHQSYLSDRDFIPDEVRRVSPKISRGENFQGLPYLVLDQPRFFEINNIFAIRTLFWWGRHFIITLHLSGRYKDMFEPVLLDSMQELASQDYFFCTSEEEWKHHIEEDNYRSLHKLERTDLELQGRSRNFLKLAKKIEFGDINNMIPRLHDEYKILVSFLAP